MSGYDLAYRLGFTPWERYGEVATASIGAQLNAVELARRGWDAVGLDHVPRAIEAARKRTTGATFVVGDVTDLESAGPGWPLSRTDPHWYRRRRR